MGALEWRWDIAVSSRCRRWNGSIIILFIIRSRSSGMMISIIIVPVVDEANNGRLACGCRNEAYITG